jgi:hypothetical protein
MKMFAGEAVIGRVYVVRTVKLAWQCDMDIFITERRRCFSSKQKENTRSLPELPSPY